MVGVRQFDERAALGRALEVFDERGFRGTSMLDLAAGTGVQRGSLYHAYGGKEEIFVRAFGDYSGRFLDGASAALRQPTRRAALSAFFDFCVAAITAGEPSRGCLSTRTAVDAGRGAPRVATEVRAFLDRLERVVRDGLAAVPDEVGPAVDPAAAARLVVTTTRGIAVMERAGFTPDQLREIAETQVAALAP